MSEQSELGKIGEAYAADHLRKNGYTILAQNYFIPDNRKAEVDIVATKENQIVFVEVKTRSSDYLNDVSLMVPIKKQRQVIKAAAEFVQEKNIDLPWRFDIFYIVMNNEYTKHEHIEDAFYPTI
jgi:putative endonuclease